MTGRVFESMGGRLGLAEGWRHGPAAVQDHAYDPTELGAVVARLLDEAAEPSALLGV